MIKALNSSANNLTKELTLLFSLVFIWIKNKVKINKNLNFHNYSIIYESFALSN